LYRPVYCSSLSDTGHTAVVDATSLKVPASRGVNCIETYGAANDDVNVVLNGAARCRNCHCRTVIDSSAHKQLSPLGTFTTLSHGAFLPTVPESALYAIGAYFIGYQIHGHTRTGPAHDTLELRHTTSIAWTHFRGHC